MNMSPSPRRQMSTKMSYYDLYCVLIRPHYVYRVIFQHRMLRKYYFFYVCNAYEGFCKLLELRSLKYHIIYKTIQNIIPIHITKYICKKFYFKLYFFISLDSLGNTARYKLSYHNIL